MSSESVEQPKSSQRGRLEAIPLEEVARALMEAVNPAPRIRHLVDANQRVCITYQGLNELMRNGFKCVGCGEPFADLKGQGKSIRAIADMVGYRRSTVQKLLHEARQTVSENSQ